MYRKFCIPRVLRHLNMGHRLPRIRARPELDELLSQIRPGGTLIVWCLDLLGRSIRSSLATWTPCSLAVIASQ
ncbi:recombinase family protein [Glutamicibacter sp. BW80]|uniref:recombinase family protein n=1 Tax=Micrococcaceae TaxID=1268 RepID=UPI001143D42B